MPEKRIRRGGSPGRRRDTKAADPERPAAGGRIPWYADRRGLLVAAAYSALAFLGGLVAAGGVLPEVFLSDAVDAGPFVVPPSVYLFAYLGALTYVFTALAAAPDVDTGTLARLGIRIPAALILVVPVTSLVTVVPVLDGPVEVRELAGIAFLVGLFVEHAIDGIRGVVLGGLARTVRGWLYPQKTT